MIAAFIIGCEIGFWLFVAAGLMFRYIFRMKRTGAFLLLCTPIVDLILLFATVIDLRNGQTASFIHGLAAIYIAVSIVFGHRMIQWADGQFAYRFAGGPKQERKEKPKYGQAHARHERITWFRYFITYVIGCVLLLAMIFFIGDAERTAALMGTVKVWSIITAVDFLYSFSFTLWPRKDKNNSTTLS
ncbi:hypothetical protein [Paenibacillus sp. NPDC058174]|uniref:hypothetical protein n=1 Tax=Paenibacillus sp. NPDC058174 TaxID=3346366 RepID=UPI0036DF1AE8